MKYFITGSTGFIGKHLLERVHGNTYLLNRHQDPKVAVSYQPDVIFHLAGEIYDETEMFDSNVKLTYDLLQAARHIPNLKAFIYIGSSSEYGRKNHPMSEMDYLDPQTLYESTKGAASLLCQSFARTYKVPVMVARPFSVYGIYEPIKRFIPTIIHSILKRQVINIAPGVHDFIHVDDFINGLLLLAENPEPGQIYNFGTGKQTSNEELVDLIEQILGKKARKKLIPKLHEYDSESWVANNSKAFHLGWKPIYTLEQGLREVIKNRPVEKNPFKYSR